MSGALTRAVARTIREDVGRWPEQPGMDHLEAALRLLAKWRSQVLARTFLARHGCTVRGGPFSGMEYVSEQSEGSLLARLLGTYESELHPHLMRLSAGVEVVVDVGCAEGYYAVGLAKAFPDVTVYAYDVSARARDLCRSLAERNGVADRVVVREAFQPRSLLEFVGRRAFVLMDVEGAELDLLRPDLAPELSHFPIIVETHGLPPDQTLQTVRDRFAATHEITRVDQSGKLVDLPDWFLDLSHLDQLIAVWEWRHRLNPWLIMEPLASGLRIAA